MCIRDRSDTALEIRPITESDWDRVFEIFRATVAEGDTYAYPEGLTSEAVSYTHLDVYKRQRRR